MNLPVSAAFNRCRFVQFVLPPLLLWIFINWKVISDCRNYFYSTTNHILSIAKSYQTTLDLKHYIRKEILSHNPQRIKEIVIKLINLLSQNHWIEKRKNRQSFEEIITLMFCNLTSCRYI